MDNLQSRLIAQAKRQRNFWTAGVAAIAGFLFVASNHTAAGTNLRTGGVEDLRGLVISRANSVNQLQTKVQGIADEVDGISERKISSEVRSTLNQLQDVTGFSSVTGSALQVTLDDAPREPGSALPNGVSPDDVVVHQQDVQAVVNAFWRSGASAVQVMDQRIIATSAIRCVGNTLLLQGRVYSPPFTITAVGNLSDLQNGLNTEPGVQIYREYVERLGLGWQLKILNNYTMSQWQGVLN